MEPFKVKDPVRNGRGGIDCQVQFGDEDWRPFGAYPDSDDEAVAAVWDAVKDRKDIAPFKPPADWKKAAQAKIREARDEILNEITDPDETQTGKIAWNAKLISSVIVLLGIDKIKALFAPRLLPPQADAAIAQIVASMTFLAQAKGMTVEQYAFSVIGKFFGFSAYVWLADEKMLEAWIAVDSLPDGAQGFAMLDALETTLAAEARAVVDGVKGLAG